VVLRGSLSGAGLVGAGVGEATSPGTGEVASLSEPERALSRGHEPFASPHDKPIHLLVTPLNPSRFRLLLAAPVLALLVGVGACRDSMRIPAPDEGGAQRPVPEPQPSTVTLPITVSLASVAAQVEKKVPHGQNHEDEWHPLGSFPVVGTLYVKEMWERDPLSIKLDGDHVNLSAHVRYRAQIAGHPCVLGRCRWVQLASCGHNGPMPSMDLGLRTTIGLNPNWTVASHTTPRRVRPGFRCRSEERRVGKECRSR